MSRQSWIGQKVGGRYQIEELLGRGGMSEVYKATDPNLKRVVAVKMIHAHLSGDPEFVWRFETEAAAVAQLRHPNIIQVYDFDNEDGNYYMVLEFVPGETLKERLTRLNQQGRLLSTKDIIHIGASVCDAADYAHKRGMIHRDLKPANVMLNVLGEAILMDFGITKIVGEKHHTATGAVIGTALYMAPEQIRGEHPDHRADIYSMGVMLFEMASGRPPFDADSAMTVMMMHLNDPLPDLRDLNPKTPEVLKGIIEKALSKDPNDRYQSAADMGLALRQLLDQPASEKAGTAPKETVVDEQNKDQDLPDKKTLIETAEPASELEMRTFVEGPTSSADQGEATKMEEPQALDARAESTYVETAAARAEPAEPTFLERPVESSAVGSIPAQPPGTMPRPVGESAAGPSQPVASKGGAGGVAIPRWGLYGGGGLIVLVLAAFLFSRVFSGGGLLAATDTPTPSATHTPAAVAVAEPSNTPVPPTPTLTPTPSKTPTPSMTPTETVPPGKYVRINGITIEGDHYVVAYETFEYTEQLPGTHVHFFYDTVSEENAGNPGKGPWILYGGPRPFEGYKLNSRPAAATQMCALVANPDHSIIPGTGNCVNLPESP